MRGRAFSWTVGAAIGCWIGGAGDALLGSAAVAVGRWPPASRRAMRKPSQKSAGTPVRTGGPTVSVHTFRGDALHPRIAKAVDALLRRGKVVAAVDVLIEMELLTPERLEDWRRGRLPYLEKVINCNLTRLSRLLRILRFHAHDLNLVPSTTTYMRWGKGPKRRLQFTKTGDPKLEEAYGRHFVWPGKGPFHPPGATKSGGPAAT